MVLSLLIKEYLPKIPVEDAIILKKQYIPGENHAGYIGDKRHNIHQAPHYALGDFQGIADIARQMVRGAGGLFLLEDMFNVEDEWFEQYRVYAEAEKPLLRMYVELLFRQSEREPKHLRCAELYIKMQEEGEVLFKAAATLLRHVSYLNTPGGGEGYSVSFK